MACRSSRADARTASSARGDSSQIAAPCAGATTNAIGYATQVLASHPADYWRFNERLNPPAATNSGSFGPMLNGAYLDWSTTLPDPQPQTHPGLDTNNRVLLPSRTNGQVLLPPLNLNMNTVTCECWLKRNGNQPNYAGSIMHRSADSSACAKQVWLGSDPATHLARGHACLSDQCDGTLHASERGNAALLRSAYQRIHREPVLQS